MAKFYNVERNEDGRVSEFDPFRVNKKQQEAPEYSSTYQEVLRIFKEALSYVDIVKIIKKL